jgi:NAD(P)-dependent dehydrogenase (short-subunit alcohol dehydrogenase family)
VPALTAVLSKSTMPAASKALALEYAAHNIRFNTVSPGIINTPMNAGGNHEMLAKFHPLGRMGEIPDIVGAVLYLQEATFVTGENIHLDGGVHAGRP